MEVRKAEGADFITKCSRLIRVINRLLLVSKVRFCITNIKALA